MVISIVKLGSPRQADEGLRIGTVRRPPRGVAKDQLAKRDFYDVWFPNLAPSADLVKAARAAETEDQWLKFVRAYKKEMKVPDAAHALTLLAAMSQDSDFSVGCYCEDESRCHRSVLKVLLKEQGALIR